MRPDFEGKIISIDGHSRSTDQSGTVIVHFDSTKDKDELGKRLRKLHENAQKATQNNLRDLRREALKQRRMNNRNLVPNNPILRIEGSFDNPSLPKPTDNNPKHSETTSSKKPFWRINPFKR